MLCPICAGQFQPREPLCPGCGCGLVPATFDEQVAGEMVATSRATVDFVELCRPRGFPVAMLIKQMLEQNGVAVLVQGGHALSVLPHLAFGGELRVLVDAEQLEFARALYRAYFESDDDIDFMSEDWY
jgi:hypothetical protein